MGKFKIGDRVRVIQIIPNGSESENYSKYLNKIGTIRGIFWTRVYQNNVKFDDSNLGDGLCFDDKELILNNVNRRVMR